MGRLCLIFVSFFTSWPVYVILICLRFLFVFQLHTGYLHPDEFFQSLEVAAGDIYNVDVLRTWEFQLADDGPLRSIAGLMPFVYFPILAYKQFLSTFLKSSLPNDLRGFDMIYRVVFPVRFMTVLLSCLVDLFIYSYSRLLDSSNASGRPPLSLLLYASSCFGGLLWGGRTIVNTWESILVALFGLLFIKVMKKLEYSINSILDLCIVTFLLCCQSAICVWALFLRPTYPLFIFSMALLELFVILRKLREKIMITLAFATCVLAALFLKCLSIDTLYFNAQSSSMHNQPFINYTICIPCRFFLYNTNFQFVSRHGVHSRFTHLFINCPLMVGPIICYFAFVHRVTLYKFPLNLTWLSVIFPIFVLSFIPHQEARFLIPCLPFIFLLAGHHFAQYLYSDEMKNRLKSSHYHLILIFIWLIHQFLLTLFYNNLHQAGLLAYMKTLGGTHDCPMHLFYRTYMPPRFPFGRPQASSSSCHEVMDLVNIESHIVNKILGHLCQSYTQARTIKLIFPGSINTDHINFSRYGTVVRIERFFPHLSIEYLPSTFSNSLALKNFSEFVEFWISQLSLHVVTVNVTCF